MITKPATLIIPFANSGSKNTIPVASQIGTNDGAASYTDGFPPATMTPKSAGGIPPDGRDENGILYDVSSHIVWLNAGGIYTFSPDIAAAGGYPVGAIVFDNAGLSSYVNTLAGNTTNFNTTPASIGVSWFPVSDRIVQSVLLVPSVKTLITGDANKFISLNGLNDYTVTLPLASTCPQGNTFILASMGGIQTIARQGADTISIGATNAIASFQISNNGNVTVVSDGVSKWYAIGTPAGVLSLNSPAFVGDPTAPTPARFDNDTSLATTAFVQQVGFNSAGVATYTASQVLTPNDIGRAWIYKSESDGTITLPAIPAAGKIITGYPSGNGVCTIQASGGAAIFAQGLPLASSVVLAKGSSITLVSDGTNWYQQSGGGGIASGSGESAVITLSGQFVDFPIPPLAKKVELIVAGASLSGTANLQVRLGVGGVPQSTGYVSGVGSINTATDNTTVGTSGAAAFNFPGALATNTYQFTFVFDRLGSSDTWIASLGGVVNNNALSGGGSVVLSGELDVIRIGNNLTNTFDAGQAAVRWYL